MTHNDGFDRTVSTWLDAEAGRGAPGYLDEILERTTRTRQRPAWSSLERWLPVQTTLRLAPVPRVAWLLVILALLIAAGVAVLTFGSPAPRLLPFGPASNGSIVYGSTSGDILAFDPVSRTTTPIISGATRDETPDFSPDGTKFVFAREAEESDKWLLMVANADGSNVQPLTGPIYPNSNAWSPDSTSVAVVDAAPAVATLTTYSLDGAAPRSLPIGMNPDRVQWRSPTELVFRGTNAGSHGLFAIKIDGSPPRALLPPTSVDTDWLDPVLSPDGSRIAYTKWVGDGPIIHVLDIDSGLDRVLVFDGDAAVTDDGWPTWSPDGTKLVLTRLAVAENHLVVGSVTGGPVVEMGPGFQNFTNGAVGIFSPDGTLIIARYGFDNEATWLLDPRGGPGERLLNGVTEIGSWQRTER